MPSGDSSASQPSTHRQIRVVLCGTDTEIGKTHVGTRIASAWVARGMSVGAFKPLESGWAGDRSDTASWMAVANRGQTLDEVCPWQLERPVTPADELERTGLRVSPGDLRRAANTPAINGADVLMVESAGGVASPVADRLLSGDLGPVFSALTVLVTSDRLGTISTTVSAAALLRARGVEPVAIVYNNRTGERRESQQRWIAELTRVPVLTFNDDSPGEAASMLLELLTASQFSG